MGGRHALLIGNCVFDDPALARLAAPEDDVISLRQVLEDPAIGGFQAELCLNAGTDPVKDAITRLFADRAPDDVLLLYYTGHGLRDDRGDLYLAVQGTKTARPRGISVGADFIRTEMQGCSARSQVLILDCCHAGAAMRDGAKAAAGAPQLYQTDFDRGGTGRYTLAASSANESAFESKDGRSVYTRHLVTALRTGAAAPERSEISVADLHAYVVRQLADEKLPQGPRLWVDDQTGPLVIARNPNPEEPVPADLLAALRDPDPLRASGAVARLTGILRGPNAARAQKVRKALQNLIDDPTRLSYGVGMEIRDVLASAGEPRPDRLAEVAALEQRVAFAEEVQAAAENDAKRLKAELDVAAVMHEHIKTAAGTSHDVRQKAEAALAKRSRLLYVLVVALVGAVGVAVYLGWQVGKLKQEIKRLTTAAIPFKDCALCPEMVVIPAGSFEMGSPETEPGRMANEGPQTRVTVASFALAKTEVTFDQWAACMQGGGCVSNPDPDDGGFGKGDHPVTGVSWNDANEYIDWLNTRVPDSPYRLPSEAEWEYAARAGSMNAYPWGLAWDAKQANGAEGGPRKPLPVASYPASSFGLFDMIGNVWEWTEDCSHESYENRPTDARPWLSEAFGECGRRINRGGSWGDRKSILRSTQRSIVGAVENIPGIGFRPARTLSP